jgi:hypothetical protein
VHVPHEYRIDASVWRYGGEQRPTACWRRDIPSTAFVSQPTGRGGYGNETQRSFGQQDHENRSVNVSDVPHLHPFTDWGPLHGSGLENVTTVHVSKRRIISKSGRFSATTAVYDGLEILCALAPNMGLGLSDK